MKLDIKNLYEKANNMEEYHLLLKMFNLIVFNHFGLKKL